MIINKLDPMTFHQAMKYCVKLTARMIHGATMKEKHAISSLGYLLADPGRTAILLALLEGRSLSAGELARAASVSAQSARAHLAQASQGGLITMGREGRCRYYKLAGQTVANALEALGAISTSRPTTEYICSKAD